MMRIAIGIAIGLVLGLAFSTMAASGYANGTRWQEANSSIQFGYTIGAVDMILDLNASVDLQMVQTARDCLGQHNWSATDILAVIKAYLVAHPDDTKLPMAQIILVAILKSCA